MSASSVKIVILLKCVLVLYSEVNMQYIIHYLESECNRNRVQYIVFKFTMQFSKTLNIVA